MIIIMILNHPQLLIGLGIWYDFAFSVKIFISGENTIFNFYLKVPHCVGSEN